MEFQAYWQALSAHEKEAFAERAGTSVGYLHLIAGGHRKPGPSMARSLSEASNGSLTLAILRPDLWGDTATA